MLTRALQAQGEGHPCFIVCDDIITEKEVCQEKFLFEF